MVIYLGSIPQFSKCSQCPRVINPSLVTTRPMAYQALLSKQTSAAAQHLAATTPEADVLRIVSLQKRYGSNEVRACCYAFNCVESNWRDESNDEWEKHWILYNHEEEGQGKFDPSKLLYLTYESASGRVMAREVQERQDAFRLGLLPDPRARAPVIQHLPPLAQQIDVKQSGGSAIDPLAFELSLPEATREPDDDWKAWLEGGDMSREEFLQQLDHMPEYEPLPTGQPTTHSHGTGCEIVSRSHVPLFQNLLMSLNRLVSVLLLICKNSMGVVIPIQEIVSRTCSRASNKSIP